jgi:hypothetical protein
MSGRSGSTVRSTVLYWSPATGWQRISASAGSIVERLTAEGVIERRADGLFDQDVSRLKYMTHLRAEHRRSPRAAADAEFALAKAELVRIRIAEKKRELIPQEEAFGQMEELVGLFLTRLSGLSVRCGGRDLAVGRAIDKAVFEMRVEISEACTKLADERNEPPLDDEAT